MPTSPRFLWTCFTLYFVTSLVSTAAWISPTTTAAATKSNQPCFLHGTFTTSSSISLNSKSTGSHTSSITFASSRLFAQASPQTKATRSSPSSFQYERSTEDTITIVSSSPAQTSIQSSEDLNNNNLGVKESDNDHNYNNSQEPQRENLMINVNINGSTYQTGTLTAKILEQLKNKDSPATSSPSPTNELKDINNKYLALLLATQQAVEAALDVHNYQLTTNNASNNNDANWLSENDHQPIWSFRGTNYTNLIDFMNQYDFNNNFNIHVHNLQVIKVDTTSTVLELSDLIQTLDPDGQYRQQAQDAGLVLPDEETLKDLVMDNLQRSNQAPTRVASHEKAYIGDASKSKGYTVLHANELVNAVQDESTLDDSDDDLPALWKQVMQGLVLHGCLLVDVSDFGNATKLWTLLWQALPTLLDPKNKTTTDVNMLPPLSSVPGMPYAKIGYAEYNDHGMSFLETRIERSTGVLQPLASNSTMMHNTMPMLMRNIAAPVAQAVVSMAVAASSIVARALESKTVALQKAKLLAKELMDDSTICNSIDTNVDKDTPLSMSPHRLCRYASTSFSKEDWKEIFGAHTDSTFITLVPVAAVAGLDVWDEDAEEWYRPELAARKHYEKNYCNDKGDNDPYWHARYMVLMPGEFLQIVTRNEVSASVHRVVVTSASQNSSRLSAPILLRARPNAKMDIPKYLGSDMNYSLLRECNNMSMHEIHTILQQK